MMNTPSLLAGIGIILSCAAEITLAEEVYGCYALQRQLVVRHGKAATSYHWYPKCLTGGYYQNVQCDHLGCYCAYVDSGEAIPNTIENARLDYLKKNCPWVAQIAPNVCSLPQADYPCKNTSRKFYFDAASGKCEPDSKSCLGFDSLQACEESCVIQKKDRCNFKLGQGRECDRRDQAERWYHDETTGSCRLFLYNGCGGNSNNYREKWICLKTCERDETTELVIQVGNTKYIIGLPTWLVAQNLYVPSNTNKLTVEEFKNIEGYMTEISKFPVREEDRSKDEEKRIIEEKLRESEKFRPKHALKNMTREEICNKKKETGPCRAFFPRWYFDKKQSKCIKFIYGGCLGNENRHITATGCAAFCNAEIPPTEAERIGDLISSGGLIGGPIENEKPEGETGDNNDDARSLSLGPQKIKPPPVELVLGESEVTFEFDDDDRGR